MQFFFFYLTTQSIFEKMKSFGQQTDTFCGKINFRSSFLELKNKQGISDSVWLWHDETMNVFDIIKSNWKQFDSSLSTFSWAASRMRFILVGKSDSPAYVLSHDGGSFSRACRENWFSNFDRNSFVGRYQCCRPFRQSSYIIRRVQKPKAPHASKHVRHITGCKRYSDVHLLHAFYSFNLVSQSVDVWWTVLSISRIWGIDNWNEQSWNYGNHCSQPIFLCC